MSKSVSGVHEQREFARIGVTIRADVQPLDAERAEALRVRIRSQPSVWSTTDNSGLRTLAQGGSTGHEAMLAQAILELSQQVVRLRSRVLSPPGGVKPAVIQELSGGGGRLVCELPLDAGDLLEIRFNDETDDDVPPIVALGKVVHRGQDACGFCFEAMHPQDEKLLMRLIYRIQRRDLRRASVEA